MIKYNSLLEIEKTCKRNRQINKTTFLPEIKQEIKELVDKKEPNEKLEQLTMQVKSCLLYTSPSPRDLSTSRMPSSA